MTRTSRTLTFHRTDGHTPPIYPAAGRSRKGQWWLAAGAGAFILAQLVIVRPGMGLSWDESVYVSQVSSHAPASFFSAPRARGILLLVAPVAGWSSSTSLLRVYLAHLSGLGLFLGLRAWRGLFPVRVLAPADALAGVGPTKAGRRPHHRRGPPAALRPRLETDPTGPCSHTARSSS